MRCSRFGVLGGLTRLAVMSLVSVGMFASIAQATMTIRSFQSLRHDRFYTGVDKAFIGASFDFSGVGKSGDRWGTMISPSYFLSARHWAPAVGSTIKFYESNDPGGISHTYTIASGQNISAVIPGYGLKLSDVWLGKLSTPVDPGIAYYPVQMLPSTDDYVGTELYNNGLGNRVGRNVLDEVGVAEVSGVTGVSYIFDYDNNDSPDVGGDETRLAVGDSGGPSFSVVNGELALLGIHWFIYDEDPEGGEPTSPGSGDSFVPWYVDALNDAMVDESITIVVPEPATLSLLAVGYWVVLARRRRRWEA